MRDRSWRRYKEKTKIIKRLKNSCRNKYYTRDGNNYIHYKYMWIDLIGTYNHFLFKNVTTTRSDSINKQKWGKKNKSRYYDHRSRISDKKFFRNLLKEDYGIVNFNFNYESVKDYTEQSIMDNIQ